MKRIIVLDISKVYAQVYDEFYLADETDEDKYRDVLEEYKAHPDLYLYIDVLEI